MMKWIRRLACPAGVFLGVVSCQSGDEAPLGPEINIVVSPATRVMSVGASLPLVARVEAEGNSGTVTWRSETPNIIAIDTTVALGQAAIARALQAGTGVVVAIASVQAGTAVRALDITVTTGAQ